MPDDLNLLLVHADDRQPVAELPEDAARGEAVPAADGPEFLWDEGGDPNDLALQRWGVVAPEGELGDRLLALIDPLVRRRQEQQDGHPVKVFRVPARMSQPEAAKWRKSVFETGADLNEDVPRYVLMLGDLHEVPFALQQILQGDGYVGRLAFPSDDGYAAYVAKVLRWEANPASVATGGAILHTVHDGTQATTVGHRALMAPGLELLRKRLESGQLPASRLVESGDKYVPSPDALLEVAKTVDPSVLFTLGHGQGAPRAGWTDPGEQRREQGALSFGREGLLRASDLAERTFLPGGIWFMLACFGAGTPDVSAYAHWLESLRAAGQFRGKVDAVLSNLPPAGERPFVAALPQAVLANPEGPLAVMGHVDLAWTYSFQDLDSGATNRPARFMGLVRALLKRDRAGIGLRELNRFFAEVNAELTALIDDETAGRPASADPARRGHLWMLRQDLAAYMLLGDPAVRLPLATPASTGTWSPIPGIPASKPAPAVSSAPAAAPAPSAPSAAAAPAEPLPLPIDRLEEAIGQVLAGERGVRAIASDYGIERAVLERLTERYREAGRRAIGG